MTVLVIVAGLVALFSSAIHVLYMLNFSLPADIIFITENVIMIILFLTIGIITRKLNQGASKEDIKQSLRNLFPEKLKPLLGLLFLYGIIIFLLYFLKAFNIASSTQNTEMTLKTFHKGLSALFMLFFTVEYFVLRFYNILVKSQAKICPNGHSTSMLSSHCDRCGIKL